VFTLGGTIAVQATPGRGTAPALSASDLLAAVPGLDEAGVELRVQAVVNKPGPVGGRLHLASGSRSQTSARQPEQGQTQGQPGYRLSIRQGAITMKQVT
jgi:hypothetical protein